jgi:secreted trypsin-like serine protease
VWEDPGVSGGLPFAGVWARVQAARALAIAAVLLVVTAGLAAGSSSAAGPDAKRVVGGDVADPAEWPYAAALMEFGSHICGATVIAPDAVLTAGHCAYFARKRHLRVVTGRPDLREEGVGQRIRVDHIHVHQGYRRNPEDHDVAVVTLRDATTAAPAALPTPEDDAAETERGDPLRVAGWGATRPGGGRSSKILLATPQHPVKPRRCIRAHGHRFDAQTQICTRGDELGERSYTTACYGDSGGPLIADTPTADLVVGVVSYGGFRCGAPNPTVYFRVASALRFIHEKAGI